MSYHILIADDEPDIVKMLAGFFSGKGYKVLTATNGIDTIKQAERGPDIIQVRQCVGDHTAVIAPVILAVLIFSVIYAIYYQVTKHSCYKSRCTHRF